MRWVPLVAGLLLSACAGSSPPHDTDAGPGTDAGSMTDAGPTDAGATDAGDYAHGFTGLYYGTWTETYVNRMDGGQWTDGGTAYVTLSYLSTNKVTVSTDCDCNSPCQLSAVTPDATSFTLELERPYWCLSGECAKTTITSGWGTRDGGVLTLQLDGVYDSPAVDECELSDFLYRRTFTGSLSCVGGCP